VLIIQITSRNPLKSNKCKQTFSRDTGEKKIFILASITEGSGYHEKVHEQIHEYLRKDRKLGRYYNYIKEMVIYLRKNPQEPPLLCGEKQK
jgi:hypothetical protein